MAQKRGPPHDTPREPGRESERESRREPFTLGDETIAPGTRRTVHLPVSLLADHTPVSLSAHVVHGRRPGPVAFVSAAVHGDELVGVEIARRLLRSARLRGIAGTLIVVPVVNAFGLLAHSRYLPDRRDLNRSFPGSPSGSLAGRLAHLFLTEIVGRCEVGIDLHTAAVHRTNLAQVRVTANDKRSMALAHAFGAPVILTSDLRDGSLRGEAAARGATVLLFEGGEALRFDELTIRAGLAGCLRTLAAIGMIDGTRLRPPRAPPMVAGRSRWVRAPAGGLVRRLKALGTVVEAGERVGEVADPFGVAPTPIHAPGAGLVVGRSELPAVNEGDALLHIAEVTGDAAERVEAHEAQWADDPLGDEEPG